MAEEGTLDLVVGASLTPESERAIAKAIGSAIERAIVRAVEQTSKLGGAAPAAPAGSGARFDFPLDLGALINGAFINGALGAERAVRSLGREINARPRGDETEDEAQSRALAAVEAQGEDFVGRGLLGFEQTVDINYKLNDAGLEADAARAGAELVAKVAVLTNRAPEQVADQLRGLLKQSVEALGGSVEENIARLGDLLASAGKTFRIDDIGQLGEALGVALPDAAAANVGLEETVTLLGALDAQGLKGAAAGRGLAEVFQKLKTASTDLDFTLVERDDGSLDVLATLENMKTKLGDLAAPSEATRASLIDAFGEDGQEAIARLAGRTDELRAAQDRLTASSDGLLDSGLQTFLNSPAGQIRRFGIVLGDTSRILGGGFLPGIAAVLKPTNDLLLLFGDAVQAVPELTAILGGAVTALIGLRLASGGVRSAWKFMMGGLDDVKKGLGLLKGGYGAARDMTRKFSASQVLANTRMGAMKVGGLASSLFSLAKGALPAVTTGFRVLGAALLSNPLGLIIAGIALAAGLIIAFWEPLRDFFLALWEPIQPVWESFAGWLGGLWEPIQPVWESFAGWLGGLWEPIQPVWESFAGWLGGLWEGIKALAGLAWEGLKEVLSWTPLGLIIENWEPISAFISGLFDKIFDIVGGAVDWISDKLGAIGDAIGGVFNFLFGDDEDEDRSPADRRSGAADRRAGQRRAARRRSGDETLDSDRSRNETRTDIDIGAEARSDRRAEPCKTVNNHYEITVSPPPGVDAETVARLVLLRLEERDRRALHDG